MCRLLTPAVALQCDCGYRFATGQPPLQIAIEPPTSALILRGILIVLMSSLAFSLASVIVLVSQPPATAQAFARVVPTFLNIPLDGLDANRVGALVGRSFWPLLGCGLGIAALKKRSRGQWQVAIALLVMSSFSPISWLNSFLVTLPLAIASSSAKGLKEYLAPPR